MQTQYSCSLRTQEGVTLVELLVVLVILSILASAAMPFAELLSKRERELELRRNLRTIRIAIDQFHDDWKNKKMAVMDDFASADGYPKKIHMLVDGITLNDNRGTLKRYLRSIPRNPLAQQSLELSAQWEYRSYRDKKDSQAWGGEDVYDVYAPQKQIALDGSKYAEW